MAERKGVLVAIEGLPCAGRTTQARLVEALLRGDGHPVLRTAEPTDSTWGKRLRESVRSEQMAPERELECAMRDREEHVRLMIRPALAAGSVVIVDGYYFGTAAHQGARGMDPVEVILRNEAFAPQPDLLVILEISPKDALARGAERHAACEPPDRPELLAAIAEIFRAMSFSCLLRLDANWEREDIALAIVDAIYEQGILPEHTRYGPKN